MNMRVLLRAVVLLAIAAASHTALCGTVTYDAGGGTEFWSNPLNWSGNALPGVSDDVIIVNAGTGTVVVDVDATVNSLTVQNPAILWIGENRTVAVNDASTVDFGGVLNLQEAATFSGTGALTIAGTLHIFGGTVGGSGALTISSGGWLRAWASINSSTVSRTTTNTGTIHFLDSGPGSHFTFSGATLTNTGTIEFLTSHNIVPGSGSPILNNNSGGVIRKSVSNSVTAIDFPVNNAAGATIEAQIGHFYLNGGGTVSGAYSILPGSQLRLGPAPNTFTMSGSPTVSGGGELRIVGATLDVGAGVDITVPNLALAFGTITGPGAVRVSGNFTWSAGKIAGSGPRVLNSTSVPTFPCELANCLLDGATLQLQAYTIYSASTNALVLSNGASLVLDPGKTINVTNDGDFLNGGGAASSMVVGGFAEGFNGCIWKTTTSGTSIVGVPVTMPGSFLVESGTLQVAAGVSVAAGAILDYRPGATIEVTGGLFLFNSSAVSFPFPGDFKVSAGTLRVPTGVTIAMPNVTLQGSGVIDGGGTLILSGTSTWLGGTMSGSGTTINPATKSLAISAPVTLDGRILQNDGTLMVSGNITGSGTIANNGTLNAAADLTFGAAVNNSGQIVTSNALSLAGNGAHGGTFTATAPGVIDFSGGTQTISGTLAGTGTLRFSGAAATVSGTWSGMPIEVSGGSVALDTNGTIPALTLSGGTLTGSGDVTVTGPSTWSGGTIGGDGGFTFDTGATVTMPGTNAATLARPLLNEGTIQFTAAPNGLLIAGVEVRNNGTVDIQSTQGITATAGTPPFLNFGTLKKSGGAGVMQFDAPLSNRGLVRIESGTMQFGRTCAQRAGKTTILSGATLQTETFSLNGGSLTGNGTVAGTVANDATVSPGASPGTLTIDGDYVQSADGALDIELRGTAPGTQYDRLLVSGKVTLGGALNVTTPNGFAPQAGDAFQILIFGSRTDDSTFAVMNGLTGSGTVLVPELGASDLRLLANAIQVSSADVRVAVTGPASTVAGSQAIYTIVVTNDGPDSAGSIVVSAAASAGLTFSANGGACTDTFPCTISALDSGQSATIVSAWNIASSATGSEQLAVDAASPVTDPNPSNNAASATTQIGTCPAILIHAPVELTSGASAAATATPFGDATHLWSIANGTIDSGNGTAGITFTVGEAGTTRLAVNVSGDGCTLDAIFDVTVKPRLTCVGTAAPAAPADGATIDAVVAFGWTAVDGASGYRLWLQQGDAPAQSLGTTLDPSRTKIIPPGAYQWYVETLFDGCASHESERRALTILEAPDCATREAPQLSAPANDTPATSAAVAFSWNAVPQALEYELWLAPAGGVPTLIRTTSDTSHTAVVPPGRLEWYVRAIFAGCAATESAHRAFTYAPPPECTGQRPLLIAPVERERLASPLSFEWTTISSATMYELYVDGVLAATTTAPQASAIPIPPGERRWHVRAHLAEGCGAVDSAESRLVVIPSPPSCTPLEAPVLSAPARVSSGVAGRIQWSFVAGATAYVVEISGDPRFPRQSTSANTVTTRRLPFTFTNQSSQPVPRYVRVYAVDTNCAQPGNGPFSAVAVLSVLPPPSSEGVALLTDPTDVPYTLDIAAELAGRSFTATPTVPWISVVPRSGIVPPGGQTLRAIAHTAGLAPGTNTGRVEITTTAVDGPLTPLPTPAFPLNLIPGVRTVPKSTPPPDALIIPAVANVTNFIVRYHSDICVTNTSAQVMRYEINFVPSGPAGMSEGQKTEVSLEPGATMAINDIVATWFGGRSSTGTLEIRPLTEIDTSTSSAPVGGLANRITFASSRTFSTTAAGGSYGQYVPAVPYANFIARGSTLSLQHIAQSDSYRTNLGLVEGSGEKVSLEVRIFDAAGTKRASFPVHLNGGERAQLNGVLQEHGLTLDDGRIEVEVTSGDGKVTAYASVIDNATNDPQLVPPVTLDQAGHTKWVVPGVADLASGSGNWQTDVRIFNAGTEAAELTLAFYSMNGGPPTTRTITLAAGEVRQLDRVLSFFGITGDAGALHIASAAPAKVVATARTYRQTDDGAYGQFIAAVRPDESVAVGSRPLQILQMEESERFKSNIGFAEVSGSPVTLEVTVFRPNANDPAVLEVKLEPNEFRQLSSLLASLGLGEMYNARISVRAVAGEGRALAYGSLIDHQTGDPTYIPGQ